MYTPSSYRSGYYMPTPTRGRVVPTLPGAFGGSFPNGPGGTLTHGPGGYRAPSFEDATDDFSVDRSTSSSFGTPAPSARPQPFSRRTTVVPARPAQPAPTARQDRTESTKIGLLNRAKQRSGKSGNREERQARREDRQDRKQERSGSRSNAVQSVKDQMLDKAKKNKRAK